MGQTERRITMNFFNRFLGTFFDPSKTFRTIAERPVWVDVLIVVLILLAVYNYLIAPYAQKDSLQLLEDRSVRLKEKWGEEGYNRYLNRVQNPNPVLTLVLTPVTYLIGFLFSSLVLLGLGKLTSTQGNYLQVFSLLLHANLVDKFLGNALRLILVLSRKSVFQTSTSLAIFFPKLEVTSMAYAVLSQVDFFQLWLFAILGIGLASAFKISQKKALFISYLFWLLKALFSVALISLQMRAMQ
jgi:hypothetical protein